jgi:DivIVA domain-containing protein
MTAPIDASQRHTPGPRLTPERVRTTQFTRSPIGRRGFSEEEVQIFLQRVAEDIAARDADDASMRATISHYQRTLAQWQAERTDHRGEDPLAQTRRPTVEAINILSRAQQEADSYVAQTQAYCRRLAVDARQHAEQILTEAQARAEEAAGQAVEEYRRRAGNDHSPEFEELERRLVWARTFLASLEAVETQLRTAREALSFEFDRLGPGSRPSQLNERV